MESAFCWTQEVELQIADVVTHLKSTLPTGQQVHLTIHLIVVFSWWLQHPKYGKVTVCDYGAPVLPWCSRGAPLVLPWCSPGAPLVLPWCSHGAPLVLPWCSRGAPVVLPWCSPGAPMVLPWCSHGAPMVLLLWCSWGAPVVLLWCSWGAPYSPVILWLLWTFPFHSPNKLILLDHSLLLWY